MVEIWKLILYMQNLYHNMHTLDWVQARIQRMHHFDFQPFMQWLAKVTLSTFWVKTLFDKSVHPSLMEFVPWDYNPIRNA